MTISETSRALRFHCGAGAGGAGECKIQIVSLVIVWLIILGGMAIAG